MRSIASLVSSLPLAKQHADSFDEKCSKVCVIGTLIWKFVPFFARPKSVTVIIFIFVTRGASQYPISENFALVARNLDFATDIVAPII